MSTTQTTVTTTTNTEPRGSSHPEAHPKSKLSRAQIAMRIELRETIGQMETATQSQALSEWERGFLADLARKFEQYGLGTRLSLAQVMTMNRAMAKAAH